MTMLTDPHGLTIGWAHLLLKRDVPQGNQAPIGVSDSVTVQRGDGPITLDVLANDVDPEGGALTLISAVATAGVAVVEADDTITYTAPTGDETQDTVTYTLADPDGAQSSATVSVTIAEPQLSITPDGDNQLVVDAQEGLVDITITAPALFAGTYQADLADLAAGPVVVVSPIITGTPEEGEVLRAEALWIYDEAHGDPVISYQWRRSGVILPGATGQTYTVGPADAGTSLTVHVTATDAAGARSATSAGLGIASSYSGALYLASDANTDGGPVSEVSPAFDAGTVAQQTVASRQPALAAGLLAFDGSDILEPGAQGYTAFASKTTLPDGAAGADAGEGFTITGLTRLANGTWAAGNAGLPVLGSPDPQVGSVVILSGDLSTIVAEYLVSAYDNSAVSPVQGVTQDGNGHVWYVAKALDKLICIDPDTGAEINQTTLSYTPNGLAWDSLAGALIVHDQDADLLRWIDPETGLQSRTRSVPGDTDQLHFDSNYMGEGAVWFTTGASGAPGQVGIMDVATGAYANHEDSFAGTAAIEGLFYDREAQRLYVADDAYFHGGTTDGNAVYTYDLAPPLERRFSLFFSGNVPAGGDTDCILGYGRWNSSVAVNGLYRPGGGNSLRLILQRGGVSGSTNFTTPDLTVDADYWVDVDLDAETATLFINGVETETVAIGPTYPTWMSGGDGGVAIGGCLRLPGNTVTRTARMNIRAAGIAFKAGQRTTIEALYT